MRCLNCKKELEQTEGKRQKQFCDSTCRSNYWQKEQRKKAKPIIQDLTKPTNQVMPITHKKPQTNTSISIHPDRLQGESSLDYKIRMALPKK